MADETPQITITLDDGNIKWESNMPMATMLYCLEVVKHLALQQSLTNE
jgi:hypothetical protein